MMSLFWYYRPEHTQGGRNPSVHCEVRISFVDFFIFWDHMTAADHAVIFSKTPLQKDQSVFYAAIIEHINKNVILKQDVFCGE